MSGLDGLKQFVNQRLSAALREICEHVDRSITEYEEELLRRWRRTDSQQLLVAIEAPPHQRTRPSPDHNAPEPGHIKQEPEELWTHHEGEQPKGLEEADVTVKSEDEEPPTSCSAQIETDGEHGAELEPARTSDSDVEPFRPNMLTLAHAEEKLFSCSICGRRFKQKLDLVHHMVHHTQQKLFCDPNFTELYQLENRMCVGGSSQVPRTPTEPQPSSSGGLMRTGADERPHRNVDPDGRLGPVGFDHSQKPFSFPETASPIGEKPLSCVVSNKSFSWKRPLKRRTRTRTEAQTSAEPVKDTFICPECSRTFVCKSYLKGHMRIHSGEARNSCSVCGKCFVLRSHLKEHMRSHTGERPFTCQLCSKSFKYSGNLGKHMKIHQRQTVVF